MVSPTEKLESMGPMGWPSQGIALQFLFSARLSATPRYFDQRHPAGRAINPRNKERPLDDSPL